MLFDILHTLKKEERKTLYKQVYEVLKTENILSVYLHHSLKVHQKDDFKEEEKEELKQEIEDIGFVFNEEICGTLAHDVELVEGCVLNFSKS